MCVSAHLVNSYCAAQPFYFYFYLGVKKYHYSVSQELGTFLGSFLSVEKMCYQKLFEIVFSLQLGSKRATSIGLVLVLFLFLDGVRGRDTTIFLQCILTFICGREEMIRTVHFNMITALPLPFYCSVFHFILCS